MRTRRLIFAMSFVALVAYGSPLRAADAATADNADVQQQLTQLRQDLADTRLQLQKARGEMADIRQFLAEKDLDQKLAEWRAERDKLAEERRLLQMERTRLEASRKALHQTTNQIAQQTADDQQKQQQQQAQALSPQWSAQYEIGLIDKELQPVVYVNRISGRVFVDQYPNVDRHNVMVRGSFYNRSQASWRYTFEIRVASAEPIGLGGRAILASWPYQTPLLTPGELHNFEVKLNLKTADISSIDIVQIGNVIADRPADPATLAPALPPVPATQVPQLPQTAPTAN